VHVCACLAVDTRHGQLELDLGDGGVQVWEVGEVQPVLHLLEVPALRFTLDEDLGHARLYGRDIREISVAHQPPLHL
jgi:hypothetical protein